MKDLHSVTDEEWATMSWLDRANVMTTTAERARQMGLTQSSLEMACQAAQFIQLHKVFSETKEQSE